MTRLGRRAFLRSSLLVAGLAACAPRTSTTGPPAVRTGELRMLNWTDYIDLDEPDGEPGTISRFAALTGITVDYAPEYEGNEDLLAIMDTWPDDAPRASIVVPTNWLAERLRADGRLERLPLDLIPNHVNLEPALLGLPWDRGARWHLPWAVGLTGLASANGAPIDTLDLLLEGGPRVSIIPEWREAVGLVMLHNGDDPGRADLASAERALELIEQAVAAGARVSYDFIDLLAADEVDVAMGWSGDVAFSQPDVPGLAFAIPDTGAIRWFDTMVIPRDAPDYATAGDFMDFVYDPTNAALLTRFVQYSSPVLGVQDELRSLGEDELADNPLLFPDADTAQRLVTWGGMSAADEDRVEARFAQVTAGAPA